MMIRLALLSVTLLACQEAQKPAPTPKAPPPKKLQKTQAAPKVSARNAHRIAQGMKREMQVTPKKGRPKNAWVDHGAPDFVKSGDGVFDEGGRRWFVAVGVARNEKNPKKAHVLADQAADRGLTKLLQDYNAGVAKEAGQNANKLAPLVKTWVEKHSTVVDHWIDHEPDDWYSKKVINAKEYAAAAQKTLGVETIAQP